MSQVKRAGLKPLRSSTNIINNKSLSDSRTNFKKSFISSSTEHYEPKVSLTESVDLKKSSTKSLNKLSTKSLSKPLIESLTKPSIESLTKSSTEPFAKSSTEPFARSLIKSPAKSFRTKNSPKIIKSTNLIGNSKQIVKSCHSAEKKKVKKAIKTILTKEQRIKKWLTTKGPVEDPEYYRLYSERLSKELTETLDRLDELELENELLVAEFKEMTKLAENAEKLNSLIKKINPTEEDQTD